MMSLPGLALFYGGMSQSKNVLSTVMQTFTLACLITLLWLIMGYSLCFSTGSPVYGNADRFWFIGTWYPTDQRSPYRLGPSTAHALAPTIPETVFMTYQVRALLSPRSSLRMHTCRRMLGLTQMCFVWQLTFAIITAAIVCGSIAERMKFSSLLIFMFFWHFLVYCPVAHRLVVSARSLLPVITSACMTQPSHSFRLQAFMASSGGHCANCRRAPMCQVT
jgi:Amt family ammonium transporter